MGAFDSRDRFTIGGKTYAVKAWTRRRPIAEAQLAAVDRRAYGTPARVER